MRSTFPSRAAALALLTLTMVPGCHNNSSPGSVHADPLDPALYPKIAALQGLAPYLVMATPPRVDQGPPMHVTCAIRAKTEYEEMNVQYRYIFFDASGRPLRDNPDWQFLRMPSRTETFFTGTALDHASDWRLEIRPAR
jgi:hypothetical protein